MGEDCLGSRAAEVRAAENSKRGPHSWHNNEDAIDDVCFGNVTSQSPSDTRERGHFKRDLPYINNDA